MIASAQEHASRLNTYLQNLLVNSPAPPEGSKERAVLQQLLSLLSNVQSLIASWGLDQHPAIDDQLTYLGRQAEIVDRMWSEKSGRPVTTPPSPPCSLNNLGACLGPALKWTLIGFAAYYGGKWVYSKWLKPTRADRARQIRGAKYPEYSTR